MAFKLPRLDRSIKIANSDGTPTPAFTQWWQAAVTQIEGQINAILAAQTAAETAQVAAETAQVAAETAQAAADSVGDGLSLTDSQLLDLQQDVLFSKFYGLAY